MVSADNWLKMGDGPNTLMWLLRTTASHAFSKLNSKSGGVNYSVNSTICA